jgi:hypothetical protein
MGGVFSNNTNNGVEKGFHSFYEVIDYIATHYILTMDFKSLSNLSDKEYCDNLVVLTADIIQKYFTDMDITYLEQRIRDGVVTNDLATGQVSFISKDMLDSLDISNDAKKSILKRRVCIGIAKFYVKIAHVFSAIVMTINPVYTYKDAEGATVKAGLLEKDKIPKAVNRKLYRLNICDNRIRALSREAAEETAPGMVSLKPKICSMNTNKLGQTMTLADEPGIAELTRLYMDDKYDYSNGTFTGMSDETKAQHLNDLKVFYTAFTGNKTMPADITKFSDIKLRDYSKTPGCQDATPIMKSKITLNKNDKLFEAYAKNIKQMIQEASANQSKLLDVINDLFTYVIDPYTGKKVIRINPKLTESSLQKVVEKTRRLIINLYVKCEQDYVNGVKLYEVIVESKIFETTQKQINNLQAEASKLIKEVQSSAEPVAMPKAVPQVVVPAPIPGPAVVPLSTSSSSSSSSSSATSTSSTPSKI